MRFSAFIGSPKTIERLKEKLRQERFPHSLILTGPEGVGKRTCAMMLAKTLNCTGRRPDDFCDTCSSCRRINTWTHPDVSLITLEEEASQIKIHQVRRILSILNFKPLEGRNKVFIIDPANLMNPEAANALLKGLEEPPDNSYFLLLASNLHDVLLTVRSRCQVYNFTPLTLEEIRGHGITDDLVARWSQGSIGRARSLDFEALRSERDEMFEFLRIVLTAREEEFQDMMAANAELGRQKRDFEQRLATALVLLMDILRLKEGLEDRIVNIDIVPQLTGLANSVPVGRLIEAAEFFRFIETSLKNYLNRQMLTDALSIVANETTSGWLRKS